MRQPQADDKKDAAWKLADAFLDGVMREPLFKSRYDRCMAVFIVVVRFLCQEGVEAAAFTRWLADKIEESVFEAGSPEEAAALKMQEERRKRTCH